MKAINKLILIFLIVVVFTPAYANRVVDSHGTHTSLQNAINIDEPQIDQVFFETLRFDRRHFYTFDAAKGETIHLEILIPVIQGLGNYFPTIAFYNINDPQRELIRFSPPMFFDEIPAQRTTVTDRLSLGATWYLNQNIDRLIDETGTYVVEIFDEGNCIIVNGGNVEKRCQEEFFSVIQGKYAFVIGTVNQDSIEDRIKGWLVARVFLEDPVGKLIINFGIIETGDSPEDIGWDDFRWIILITLIIITVIIIWKREHLSRRI